MNRYPDTRWRAEQLAAKIRWLVWIAAALFILPQAMRPTLVLGLATWAVLNYTTQRWVADRTAYDAYGGRAMTCLRVLDAVGAGLICLHPALAHDNLWLLAVPSILAEPLVTRRIRSTGAVILGGVLGVASARLVGPVGAVSFWSAASVYSLTGASGLVLGFYSAKEEVLRSHDKRLDTVLECATTFAASGDLKSTIVHTLRAGVNELDALAGYVMLTDERENGTLQAEAAYSPAGEFKFPQSLPIGSGITGYAARMGQPIVVQNGLEEQLRLEGIELDGRSAVSVPLVARSHWNYGSTPIEYALGAITLIGRTEKSFSSPEDMQLLRSLAALTAASVANSRMELQQRTTFLKTLESLAKSLEARDNYTRGHSQRASEVSIMIGEALGFSDDALEELRVGTILHDIGKIGVPDSILHKPGRLTDEEFATMRDHPVIGYEICRPLVMSEGILLIIRNHHEKLDGSGYPDGLKGGELPLSLRIICVADAFDAMSSRRPYRDVMDLNRVLAELSRGAGVQFDPVVVEALRDLLPADRLQACYREQWAEPREEAA